MTTEEFSNEFDTLLNSYSIINAFGNTPTNITLDEYEKSLLLTKAQEEIVLEFYNGKNTFRDSFEKTEEIRRYLNKLIKTYIISNKEEGYTGLSSNSIFFKLPDDLWFITYESVKVTDERLGCKDNRNIIVVPTTQDEYYRVNKNPFRNSNDKRALRLDVEDNTVEIISEYNVSEYKIRYISKPEPIVLIDLPDGLSINNVNIKTECKLNPVIHRIILEKAIELAIKSKSLNTGK